MIGFTCFPVNIRSSFCLHAGNTYIRYVFLSSTLGLQYWKYHVSSAKGLELEKGFPRNIDSFWKGIPSSVDAAYYDQMRYIHFFKDNKVYTFDTHNLDEVSIALCV